MPPRFRLRRTSSASVQTVVPLSSRRNSSSSERTIRPSNSYDTDFLLIDELASAGAHFESHLQNKRSSNNTDPPSDDDLLSDIRAHNDVSPAAKNFSNNRRQIEVFLESGYGDMPAEVRIDVKKRPAWLGNHATRYNDAIDRLYKEGVGPNFPLPKDIAKIGSITFELAVRVAQHVKEANAQLETEREWREGLYAGLEQEIEDFIAKYWPLTAEFRLSNSKIYVLKGKEYMFASHYDTFREFYKRRMTSMRDGLHKEEAEKFAANKIKLAKFKALRDGHGMDAVSMATHDEE